MVKEIVLPDEGWSEIKEKLDTWDRHLLIAAIADDKFERVLNVAGFYHAIRAFEFEKARLSKFSHESLSVRALALIKKNNTCENDGRGFWIDREGFHVVLLD